jgi:transposase
MTLFALSYRERVALGGLAAHTEDAKVVCRANALLWLDDGESAEEVAERLRVSRQTVYNWAIRFQRRGEFDISARVADGPRRGRPRTAHGIIDPLIEEALDQNPEDFGYNSTIWTAPLLAHYLLEECGIEVSCDSVSLAIRRLRIRWKRPRHHLTLCPDTWRQAKGGLNTS